VAVTDPLAVLRGGLVVSVQADAGTPLAEAGHLAAVARAAVLGGARGIRAEGIENLAAIRQAVDGAIIGLWKRRTPDSDVYITPTLADARAVAATGVDLVAVDATDRPRPDGGSAAQLVADLTAELGDRVLADVDCLEAGVAARAAGAAAVATTLAGYTDGPQVSAEPDVELVARLSAELDCPVLAEGRYATPAHVAAAFAAGAHAVVVGRAISDPIALTRRLAAPTVGDDG
jgi:N-acylglucosamine-6-phosphate 2-epimerase